MDGRGSRATVRLEGAAVVDTAREALAHNRSDESECDGGTDGGTAAGGSEVGPPARSPLCRRSFSAPSDRLAPPSAALAFPVSAIGAQSAPIVPRLPRLRISLARNTAHGRVAYLLLFHAGLHEAEEQEGKEKAKRMRAAVSRSGAGIPFVWRGPRVTLGRLARPRAHARDRIMRNLVVPSRNYQEPLSPVCVFPEIILSSFLFFGRIVNQKFAPDDSPMIHPLHRRPVMRNCLSIARLILEEDSELVFHRHRTRIPCRSNVLPIIWVRRWARREKETECRESIVPSPRLR